MAVHVGQTWLTRAGYQAHVLEIRKYADGFIGALVDINGAQKLVSIHKGSIRNYKLIQDV